MGQSSMVTFPKVLPSYVKGAPGSLVLLACAWEFSSSVDQLLNEPDLLNANDLEKTKRRACTV